MPRNRLIWAVTLVAALVALGSSIGWGVAMSRHAHRGMDGYGAGMMGYVAGDAGAPVTDLVRARQRAGDFAGRLDLRVGEVMRFSDGFYAELIDRDGRRATEVLIDPRTGATWFEYGPAMMWNTRFGMMRGGGSAAGTGAAMTGWMMGRGGMMGGGTPADPTWTPGPGTGAAQIDASEARRLAQRWLGANRSGTQAGEAEGFPGYYTLHVERGGKIQGMLSVNAYTGAVWYHWWHGRFVAMDG